MRIPEPNRRFYDAELILRYLALSECYDPINKNVTGYRNKMKTFLNSYMASKSDISEQEFQNLSDKFKRTVDKVYSIFGNSAFIRYSADEIDTRVNRALMDVIMIGAETLTKDQVAQHKQSILELHHNLPVRDTTFNDALTYGTNDTKKLEYRINTWLSELKNIVGT